MAALDVSILSTTQSHAVKQAYAHAFKHTLRVSTIISGISMAFALLSYQKNPPTIAERMQQQIAAEIARQMAMRRGPPGVSVLRSAPTAKEKGANSSKSSDLS